MYRMKFIKSVPDLKGEGNSTEVQKLISDAYTQNAHWWIEDVRKNKTIYVNLDNVAYIITDNDETEESDTCDKKEDATVPSSDAIKNALDALKKTDGMIPPVVDSDAKEEASDAEESSKPKEPAAEESVTEENK